MTRGHQQSQPHDGRLASDNLDGEMSNLSTCPLSDSSHSLPLSPRARPHIAILLRARIRLAAGSCNSSLPEYYLPARRPFEQALDCIPANFLISSINCTNIDTQIIHLSHPPHIALGDPLVQHQYHHQSEFLLSLYFKNTSPSYNTP